MAQKNFAADRIETCVSGDAEKNSKQLRYSNVSNSGAVGQWQFWDKKLYLGNENLTNIEGKETERGQTRVP